MVLSLITNKKGMSGISTLIIFIALILVAAITASTLLGVTGTLQSQALKTGSESKTTVSTKLQVQEVFGEIEGTSTYANYLRIVVRLSPGSSKIGLNDIIMSVQTESGLYSSIDYNESVGDSEADMKNAVQSSEVFSVRWLTSPPSARSSISDNDLIEIWFYSNSDITADEKVIINIVPLYGTGTKVSFITSPSFYKTYERFYP